jgi:clan AA aspartic protease
MIRCKDDNMGRFSVEVELANSDDMALARRQIIPVNKIHRVKIKGVVDSGATSLVIPKGVANELGLSASDKTRVRYADGRSALRDVAEVYLEWAGRHGIFSAVLEPKREDALIGAIVLEVLDLIVDCRHQTLAPRDPKHIISELESQVCSQFLVSSARSVARRRV